MKKTILILVTVIFLTSTFTSCRMYSKFPKVSILTSKGIEYNDDIFFLIHYRIFRRPEGIMRFPDGGLPKDLVDEYYIVKHQKTDKENKLIYKLSSDYSRVDLRSADISENNGKIYFLIERKNKDRIWGKGLYIVNPETGETVVKTKDIKIIKREEPDNIIGIGTTNEFMRFIYDYKKIGLPDPLEYMRLSDRNIKEILLHDYLNGRMHAAVIYYLVKNDKNELLDEIEKENTDKYISGEIRFFKEGWSDEQLREYFNSIK